MNIRDEEVHPVDKKGKRVFSASNQELPTCILKFPDSNSRRPTFNRTERHPAYGTHNLPVVIDKFGAINILPKDKFGAVQEWDGNQSSSFGSTYSRGLENAEVSTGSFLIAADDKKNLEEARQKLRYLESGAHFLNESGWGQNQLGYSTLPATSNPCSSRVYDGSQSNSTTYTCTLEQTSIDNDENCENRLGGPSNKRLRDSSRYDEEKWTGTKYVLFQSPETTFPESTASHASSVDDLFPSTGLGQTLDSGQVPPPAVQQVSHSFGETRLQSAGLSSTSHNPSQPLPFCVPVPSQSLNLNLNQTAPPLIGEELWSSGSSFRPEDESVREIYSNYKFASIDRQAYLRKRMEERQTIQDATPVHTVLPETHGAERCRHVVSPEVSGFSRHHEIEDLVWLNVRSYCGMVLDRETGAVLGTAVLFIPSADSKNSKRAWVTSVNVVEGRWEVVIKDSKGETQVAKLMLTSTEFGLAFFTVRTRQKTFALAFLNMVAGQASLPHRISVDAERGDKVYVFGYEEPWESELGKISDVRVRAGKIAEAGNMEVVMVDFTKGQLGGSITTPAGFSGGLVARADGLWMGIVTGQTMPGHPSRIGFCSAYNVYSLLEELE